MNGLFQETSTGGKNIACLGAGLIGTAWAITFARAGREVLLYDCSEQALERAELAIEETLAQLAATGMPIVPDAVTARIHLVRSLEDAVHEAAFVQESIAENLESKRDLFAAIGPSLSPDTIVASSTSELVPTSLFEGIQCAPQALVVHPINPPYLIPVVELCRSPWTTDRTYDACRSFMIEIGQQPILVRREISGFIVNRLQAALLGETMHLIGEGYATVNDIDKAVADALGLRWALLGPIMTAHLNAPGGLVDYMSKFRDSYASVIRTLRVNYEWSDELIQRLSAQIDNDESAGAPLSIAERDRFIVRLRALKQSLKAEASPAISHSVQPTLDTISTP